MSDGWVDVARTSDIPPGCAARVEIDETPVAIFNVDGTFYALDDTCSHAEASLSEGDLDLDRCVIECPLHGSSFDLRTGEPLSLPAVEPVRVHRIETTEGGLIRVALAAACKRNNPGGNDLANDLIRVPEAVNVVDCLVVGVRHQLNVCRFKHCIADERNYRGHGSPH